MQLLIHEMQNDNKCESTEVLKCNQIISVSEFGSLKSLLTTSRLSVFLIWLQESKYCVLHPFLPTKALDMVM